mgnify:CR=1 FL=1|tara:strand:+ start:1035 stop:1337 length:303 start_codon:yes stop_codon:yes gene_type:complete
MNGNNNSDDQRGEATLRREERKHERSKAKASSLEANMREQIAAFMSDEGTKKAIAKDAMAATKDPSRKSTNNNTSQGRFGNSGDDFDEIITGLEDRVWER